MPHFRLSAAFALGSGRGFARGADCQASPICCCWHLSSAGHCLAHLLLSALPAGKHVDPARNSKLYVKVLDEGVGALGSRPAIGASKGFGSFGSSMGAVMVSGRGLGGASVAGGGMTSGIGGGGEDGQGRMGDSVEGMPAQAAAAAEAAGAAGRGR